MSKGQFMKINPSSTPKPVTQVRGYGLVEMMLAITMAAVLIAVGVQAYRGMREKQVADAQVRHLTQIITALQKSYGMVGYSGLDSCTATAYVVPSELWDASNTCTLPGRSAHNISDGAITFTPVTVGSIVGAQLQLVWERVPSSQCADVITGVQALADVVELRGALRTGTPSPTIQPVYKSVKASGQAINMASVTEWCSNEELSGGGPTPTTNPISRVNLRFTITR
jgi:type II secretory pathway pseudopilin PulG